MPRLLAVHILGISKSRIILGAFRGRIQVFHPRAIHSARLLQLHNELHRVEEPPLVLRGLRLHKDTRETATPNIDGEPTSQTAVEVITTSRGLAEVTTVIQEKRPVFAKPVKQEGRDLVRRYLSTSASLNLLEQGQLIKSLQSEAEMDAERDEDALYLDEALGTVRRGLSSAETDKVADAE